MLQQRSACGTITLGISNAPANSLRPVSVPLCRASTRGYAGPFHQILSVAWPMSTCARKHCAFTLARCAGKQVSCCLRTARTNLQDSRHQRYQAGETKKETMVFFAISMMASCCWLSGQVEIQYLRRCMATLGKNLCGFGGTPRSRVLPCYSSCQNSSSRTTRATTTAIIALKILFSFFPLFFVCLLLDGPSKNGLLTSLQNHSPEYGFYFDITSDFCICFFIHRLHTKCMMYRNTYMRIYIHIYTHFYVHIYTFMEHGFGYLNMVYGPYMGVSRKSATPTQKQKGSYRKDTCSGERTLSLRQQPYSSYQDKL